MTSRNYDVVLKIADASLFTSGNVVVGNTTATTGYIASVDTANNILKVKLANLLQEFNDSEYIHSNIISISKTANGAIDDSSALPFYSNVMSGNVVTAKSQIVSISPSTFIAEKNAFTQNPIVRLYTLFYPGEWYPPNEFGNPSGSGEGLSWPSSFPLRFAEVVGDTFNDLSYNVTYDGVSYIPYPVSVSGIEQSSDGKVNELSLTVFNVDNIISRLVEDPYICGNNSSNSVSAYVNGELLNGIDARTIPGNIAYDESIVSYYGKTNAAFDYTQTIATNGNWDSLKVDSRDMLGGVVEIKTTFANFLDYWPEYSLVTDLQDTKITVKNAMPYRVGDTVKLAAYPSTASILSIDNNQVITTNVALTGAYLNQALYIVNQDADSESYLEDKFRIDQLESLTDHLATFGLVSWLQYFKVVIPKRKYYKNTCQWVYKGQECQYPGPGGLPIPGTDKLSNAHSIGINNEISSTDVCAKSFKACELRNNQLHFGGFVGVGRTIPRA